MATRERPVDRGDAVGRRIVAELGRELRLARRERSLSLREVGRAVGLSAAHLSRIERGTAGQTSVVVLSRSLAVVGMELSARAFPAGVSIRDRAHTALLERLRARLHASLGWATEVPLPRPGDLRAWDAIVRGPGWLLPIEAETRARDLQALERRIALKLRDTELEHVLLLLSDSRLNRLFIRSQADALSGRFPVPGRRALELLGAGVSPHGSAIVLL